MAGKSRFLPPLRSVGMTKCSFIDRFAMGRNDKVFFDYYCFRYFLRLLLAEDFFQKGRCLGGGVFADFLFFLA